MEKNRMYCIAGWTLNDDTELYLCDIHGLLRVEGGRGVVSRAYDCHGTTGWWRVETDGWLVTSGGDWWLEAVDCWLSMAQSQSGAGLNFARLCLYYCFGVLRYVAAPRGLFAIRYDHWRCVTAQRWQAGEALRCCILHNATLQSPTLC